jgi:hypothetical protein
MDVDRSDDDDDAAAGSNNVSRESLQEVSSSDGRGSHNNSRSSGGGGGGSGGSGNESNDEGDNISHGATSVAEGSGNYDDDDDDDENDDENDGENDEDDDEDDHEHDVVLDSEPPIILADEGDFQPDENGIVFTFHPDPETEEPAVATPSSLDLSSRLQHRHQHKTVDSSTNGGADSDGVPSKGLSLTTNKVNRAGVAKDITGRLGPPRNSSSSSSEAPAVEPSVAVTGRLGPRIGEKRESKFWVSVVIKSSFEI